MNPTTTNAVNLILIQLKCPKRSENAAEKGDGGFSLMRIND